MANKVHHDHPARKGAFKQHFPLQVLLLKVYAKYSEGISDMQYAITLNTN